MGSRGLAGDYWGGVWRRRWEGWHAGERMMVMSGGQWGNSNGIFCGRVMDDLMFRVHRYCTVVEN